VVVALHFAGEDATLLLTCPSEEDLAHAMRLQLLTMVTFWMVDCCIAYDQVDKTWPVPCGCSFSWCWRASNQVPCEAWSFGAGRRANNAHNLPLAGGL